MMIDLDRVAAAPLTREPFEFFVVPEFIKAEHRPAINADFPRIERSGSFPLSEVQPGPKFNELMTELNSAAMREAFARKFELDLTDRPSMITVRGRCSEKDGRIHTDSTTKIITILIYLNPGWARPGGRLRLLRSGDNLDDVIQEVPPEDGTLLAFRRCDRSWHGHQPFVGERRVIQFNWVTSAAVVRREQTRHRFSAALKKLFRGGGARP